MRTVYKYALNGLPEQELMLPQGAELLTAAFQGDVLQLWALIDTDAPLRARRIGVFGTGHTFKQQSHRYIATAHMASYALVFHVFEVLVF